MHNIVMGSFLYIHGETVSVSVRIVANTVLRHMYVYVLLQEKRWASRRKVTKHDSFIII